MLTFVLINVPGIFGIQWVTVTNVIASNNSEKIFPPWKQAGDSVLIAVDLLSCSEPSGSTSITFQDDIMSMSIIHHIWGMIPFEGHSVWNFLDKLQISWWPGEI